MEKYRLTNIVVVAALLIITMSTWLYWNLVCGGHSCSYYFIDWYLDALLWGPATLSLTALLLLLFPAHIFRNWLWAVASWSIPLMVFAILTTDPRSSHVLSLDRGQVAWVMGGVVLLATIVFLLFSYAYPAYKKQPLPRPLWYLVSVPLVFTLFWYLRALV